MLVYVLPLLGLAALGAYQLISFLIQRQRHAARAKELGCKAAPLLPEYGFLGLQTVKTLQAADRAQKFPDLLLENTKKMTKIMGYTCSTFKIYVLGQYIYSTSDPLNIQAMLAKQFDDYDLGPARRANMIVTLGDGIFVQDGKGWEHSRALLRPNFVREQISDLDLEERHVQNLIGQLPAQHNGWTRETDIQKLFFRLTIDSACEFLFGESLDSQIAGDSPNPGKDEVRFSEAWNSATLHLAKRFRLADMYWLHQPAEFKRDNAFINDFISHYVKRALAHGSAEKKADEGASKQPYVLLEELAKQTRDPEELRGQLLNILLAGRDTTASLLSWVFHQLLRHPDVFEQLRATVLQQFGTYDDPRDITFAALKGCQYLQYVLNETLRLWPVVPGNGRRTNKATTLPRGGGPDGMSPIFLPAQTEVNYSVHVMHRRVDLWGEDAAEFKPERFAGRKPGWEYLPFNGGPRICIGQQFALTEASYVVVRLLQRFDNISASPEELSCEDLSNLTLTNCPGRPVKLQLHEAKY